jgi:hypothetical protein
VWQVAQIAASIAEFGFNHPILVDTGGIPYTADSGKSVTLLACQNPRWRHLGLGIGVRVEPQGSASTGNL